MPVERRTHVEVEGGQRDARERESGHGSSAAMFLHALVGHAELIGEARGWAGVGEMEK